MKLRAGSWPWLLVHEIRLGWRNIGGASPVLLALAGVLWLVLHLVAWPAMGAFSPAALGTQGMQIASVACWFAITLMLSTAIILAVNALYDRGDLDLLIASPLPTRTVFTVRGMGVCLSSLALFAGLLLPFAHMGALRGHWQLLAAYPVLLSIGLGLSGLALALTLFLVRRIGARRARVLSQVIGALIGALLFLAFQIPNMLPEESLESAGSNTALTGVLAWFGAESALSWPMRALIGEPLPLLAIAAIGVGLFVTVIRITHDAFLAGTQESTTVPPTERSAAAPVRFRSGLARNVIRKELLLIRRDPSLISQTLLQSLYLLPMFFIVARNSELVQILAPAIVLISSQIAGNLAWITISGEEAPDLIGGAPIAREKALWLKAVAAVLPVAVCALPFVVFYAMQSAALAAIFVFYLLLALVACAVTQIWGGKPTPKRDLKQRQKHNKLLNVIEMISALGIAGACFATMSGSGWALAGLAVGSIAPLLAWSMRPRTV